MRTVIKSDGRKEEFDPNKVLKSCLRLGLGKRKCEEVVDSVIEAVSFPVRTKKLSELIRRFVSEYGEEYPFIYGLRYSIAELDSTTFEKFVAKLLEENGFRTEWNRIVKGYSVEHQVDVVARKGNKTYLVECKLHKNPHRDSGLGTSLQVWARWLDIQENKKREYDFDRSWVVTNTKFSDHAKQFSAVRGIWLTGWRYDGEKSMEFLAESTGTVPITILNLDYRIRRKLINRNILTLRDFVEHGHKFMRQSDFSSLRDISKRIMKRLMSKWKS